MKKSKLSRRITWHVIGIMSFFNVLIIGVILVFVFRVSLVNSSMRGQYVVDRIEDKHADFLLVDKDVLSCPVTEIHDAKAAATYFEGKKVFSL